MFTEEQLAEILAVCEKATEGPWETTGRGSEYVINKNNFNICLTRRSHDAQFIALARTALPQLAEKAQELEAENAKLRAVAETALLFIIAAVNGTAGDRLALFAELWRTLVAAGYGGEE
jgi:hypothetical protein